TTAGRPPGPGRRSSILGRPERDRTSRDRTPVAFERCARPRPRGAAAKFVMRVAQFFTMLLFSLVTGVFWGTWFSLSRSIGAITPATFLEVGHTMIGNLGGPMSVLMPATLLSAIILAVLLFRRGQTRSSVFTVSAFVLLVVAMIITLTVNVPIDRQIQSWTTTTLPADWSTIRDRWELYHGLRTFVSLVALAALFAGTLSSTKW